jgi:RNA polymerase sigma-70 factor (ECF subfamily)
MTEPDRRFTTLYDQWQPRVYAYVAGRAGHGVADEVVSETFLIAWRRLDDIPRAELAWLLGVARNLLRERYRAELRDRALDAELRTRAPSSTGDVAEDVTERAQVLRALASLSGDDRELLTLVAWHGLTSREAAQVLGCSTATYFVRLHRARRRFESALSRPAVLTMEGELTR